jgi:hypothetical protein
LEDKLVKEFESFLDILVYLVLWAHNYNIFIDADIPHEVTASLILNLLKEFKVDQKIKNPRIPFMLDLDFKIPWGYFDGASQGHPTVCGVEVVLFMNQNHCMHIIYAPGHGLNNRVEFLALRTPPSEAHKKGIRNLQVLGYSKLVIEWESKKYSVVNVCLGPLFNNI